MVLRPGTREVGINQAVNAEGHGIAQVHVVDLEPVVQAIVNDMGLGAGGGTHPDYAAHVALGLAPGHGHEHDHSALYAPIHTGHAHNHDGQYAAPHTGHAHDHDAAYAPIHAHPYAPAGDYATQAELDTHAGTPHGGAAAAPTFTNLGAVAPGALDFSAFEVIQVSPTATGTFTATVPPAGSRRVMLILQTATTAKTMTFGAGFKPSTTLALGTTANRMFVVEWVSNGSFLYEQGRTAAIPA